MYKLVLSYLKGGDIRTVKAKKNIIASIAIKGLSIVVGFLLIRVTLNYLDTTKYGIWLTLTSFLTWLTFFEIGLDSGLKNKLAEALALKDYKLAKIYLSTTYAILTIVISIVAIIFFIANFFIDWTIVLNTDKSLYRDLKVLATVVFNFFFLTFVLKLIGTVLNADQRPALANTFGPIGNVIVLLLIYVLTRTTDGSLVYLGWIMSSIPVIVLVIASYYFYKNDYNYIMPSLKDVKFMYAKGLLNLGFKFFIIQIVALVIYQSSNIIIAQYFGPAEVTTYNIAYKYFSIIMMLFTIVIAPFWSAYTEAWVKDDIIWIKRTVRKLLKIWLTLCGIGLIMLLFSNQFYKLWLGDKIEIPFNLSLVLYIYFVTFTFGGVFNMFINGVGKVKLQMYIGFFEVIIFILSAIIFINYFQFGILGLVFAMILSNLYGIILSPIQYNMIVNKKAKGIWNK